jgi:hypothetical protein
MAFDTVKFEGAKFEERTSEVPMPGLAPFFDDDDKHVFVVRGVTAEELALAREQVDKNKAVRAALASDAATASEEVKAAIKTLVAGADTKAEAPDRHVLNLNLAATGIVTPELSFSQVVKLAEKFPVEFNSIAQEVMRLTGLGQQVKK